MKKSCQRSTRGATIIPHIAGTFNLCNGDKAKYFNLTFKQLWNLRHDLWSYLDTSLNVSMGALDTIPLGNSNSILCLSCSCLQTRKWKVETAFCHRSQFAQTHWSESTTEARMLEQCKMS